MTETQKNQRLATFLWEVTHYVFAMRGKNTSVAKLDLPALFRYVAFCHLTGRLSITRVEGLLRAVAFSWPDWAEHVEAKAAEGIPQFEWTQLHKGDCIFLADVIGDREGVAQLWEKAVEIAPQLVVTPIYTFRRGKLVRLTLDEIERFSHGWRR